jgi:hypothetical protein
MWTSAAKLGYMLITIHYITKDWKMKVVIIAFVWVLYLHAGKWLGAQFIQFVQNMDPQLLRSIWGITINIAANNSTMLHHSSANLQRNP